MENSELVSLLQVRRSCFTNMKIQRGQNNVQSLQNCEQILSCNNFLSSSPDPDLKLRKRLVN